MELDTAAEEPEPFPTRQVFDGVGLGTAISMLAIAAVVLLTLLHSWLPASVDAFLTK